MKCQQNIAGGAMDLLNKEISEELRDLLNSECRIQDGDYVPPVVVRPRFICVIKPGSGHIDDVQAAHLQSMVRCIVGKHHVPFQTVWTLLNRHAGVPSYRLTPQSEFSRCVAFLEYWSETSLPPL